MSSAVLQFLGVIASAGLGALATFATLFNSSERRLKRLERITELREKAAGADRATLITFRVAEDLAAQEVLVDIDLSRRHPSRWVQYLLLLVGSLVGVGAGAWLLQDSDYFRVVVTMGGFIFAYATVLIFMVERGRLERARAESRSGLDTVISEARSRDPQRGETTSAEGSAEGDVPAP